MKYTELIGRLQHDCYSQENPNPEVIVLALMPGTTFWDKYTVTGVEPNGMNGTVNIYVHKEE